MVTDLVGVLQTLKLVPPGPLLLPFCATCPLCKATHALEVRGSEDLECQRCGFLGDLIQLSWSSARKLPGAQDLTLASHLSEMMAEGLVRSESTLEVQQYLDDVRLQAMIQILLQACYQRLSGDDSILRVLLGEAGLTYQAGSAAQSLSGFAAPMFKKEFQQISGELPGQALGGSMAAWENGGPRFVLPAYSAWRVVGFWVLHHPEPVYFHVDEDPQLGHVGLRERIANAEQVLVCQSPLVALRLLYRQALDGRLHTKIWSCSAAPTTNDPHDSPVVLGNLSPVYLGFERDAGPTARWIKRAVRCPGAKMVQSWRLGWSPERGWPGYPATSEKIIRDIVREAQRPLDLVARWAEYLMEQPSGGQTTPRRLRGLLAELDLSPEERAQVLAGAREQSAEVLRGLIDLDNQRRTVEVDGKRITETIDGWFVGPQQLSDVVVRIREIIYSGETKEGPMARGVLVYQRRAIEFECSVRQLTDQGARWVRDHMMRNMLGVPVIGAKLSGPALFNLAVRFHQPALTGSLARYGWDRDVLRLARCSFSRQGTRPEPQRIDGPMVVPPALEDLEPSWLQNTGACELGLALLANLLRTRVGKPAWPILLRESPQAIDQLAVQLGQHTRRDDVGDTTLLPLPACVQWGDTMVREALQRGRGNWCCSVDRRSWLLAELLPEVQCIGIEPGLLFNPCWVLSCLPRLLGEELDLEAPGLYFRLAQVVQSQIETQIPALAAAGRNLDAGRTGQSTTQAQRIMCCLASLEREQLIELTHDARGVRVDLGTVQRMAAASAIPVPDMRQLIKVLTDSRFIQGQARSVVWLQPDGWGMLQALAASR